MAATANRLDRLRARFDALGVDGFYTEDPVHIRYLTGFPCAESALLAARERAVFITDFRYRESAEASLAGIALAEVDQGAGCIREACRQAATLGIGKLGFEENRLPYGAGDAIVSALGRKKAVPLNGVVEGLRAVKDAGEREGIRKALAVAEEAFRALRGEVHTGLTEKAVADRLEGLIREKGGLKGAFDFAVLVRERGSLPHGVPGPREIEPGDPVLFDFGAIAGDYFSDLTRMLYFGEPPAKFAEIHRIVQEAQAEAFAAVRPGIRASEVDRAAREAIARAGYGKEFGHGLGHGVGLEIHEGPRISWLNDAPLEPGMVFTVEPGIYLPGRAGVRIEDMVEVTETGVRVLSTLPASVEESIV
jgi:Xaa-Pro aminopeptidase